MTDDPFCGAVHPETGRTCILRSDDGTDHPKHCNRDYDHEPLEIWWDNDDYIDPRPRKVDREEVREVASRVREGVREDEQREAPVASGSLLTRLQASGMAGGLPSAEAHVHRNGPEVSRVAARSQGDVKEAQYEVLELIADEGPMSPTDVHEEMCARNGQDPNKVYSTYRSRVSELHTDFDPPLVRTTGQKGRAQSGDAAADTWVVTEMGLRVLGRSSGPVEGRAAEEVSSASSNGDGPPARTAPTHEFQDYAIEVLGAPPLTIRSMTRKDLVAWLDEGADLSVFEDDESEEVSATDRVTDPQESFSTDRVIDPAESRGVEVEVDEEPFEPEVREVSEDITLLRGDALAVLRTLDDDSIHAIVTDPPYGLSKEPDPEEVLRHWLAGDDYIHRGGGFMGKDWDSFVPGPSVWKEAMRVLKPGGYLLCFAGSRTVDLMGLAIRLAGFEIRDQMQWLYGSGFPKSLDVRKAVDAHLLTGSSRPQDQASLADRDDAVIVSEKPGYSYEGVIYEKEGRQHTRSRETVRDVAPITYEAARWDGWGTALKPAHEPIIVARKSPTKTSEKTGRQIKATVAECVLEHGTAGLNIDGTRISAVDKTKFPVGDYGDRGMYGTDGERTDDPAPEGRWPANVVLDEMAGAILDEQTGELTSGAPTQRQASGADKDGNTSSAYHAESRPAGSEMVGYGDSGGASRFYYCAKASKSERNEGLPEGMTNHHSTVKPVDIMRYLTRLVTPPGGTVLDPYMGSGTTGIACVHEGFAFIGIDLDTDNDGEVAGYLDIAEARIRHAIDETDVDEEDK